MGALYLTILHLIELDERFWRQTICRFHYLAFGDAGLEDRNSNPGRVWNRIPDDVRDQIVDLALDETDLSPGLSVSGSCFESIPGDGKGIVAVR